MRLKNVLAVVTSVFCAFMLSITAYAGNSELTGLPIDDSIAGITHNRRSDYKLLLITA